eukprot:symbB.v1.2.025689.t1/scaffold2428.1/size79313/6
MALPLPGPSLHSGLFRERTISEVQRCIQELRQGPEQQRVLEVLDCLANFVIDRAVLQQSGVIQELKKLSTGGDEKIAMLVKDLRAQWKEDVKLRDQVVEGFCERGGLDRKQSREMEEGLFNSCCPLGFLDGEEKKNYNRHYKRLRTLLGAAGPGSLSNRLKSRELLPSQVAAMSDEDLRSEAQRKQQSAARNEGLQATLLSPAPPAAVTEDYACQKCGSHNCYRTEVQTGWHNDHQDATLFVVCLSCGHRWKESDDHGLAG